MEFARCCGMKPRLQVASGWARNTRMTLTIPDLENLQGTALSEFEKRAAAIPPEQHETFAQEVARLEGQLEAIYRMAVLLQRREESMEAAFGVWDAMVRICDSFLWKLEALRRDHPSCAVSHDKMLDLRLAAEKRREMHRKPGREAAMIPKEVIAELAELFDRFNNAFDPTSDEAKHAEDQFHARIETAVLPRLWVVGNVTP